MSTASAAIPTLTRWGLSADADLVYRGLVLVGPMDEHRLTRELGMTRVRVRAAIDELAAKAAASSVRDRAWRATPPPEVLRRLRHRATVRSGASDRWPRHLATLAGLDDAPPADGDFRRWGSRALARRRVAQLAATERHEHLAINTEENFGPESLAAAQPLDRGLLSRGVRMRVIGRPPRDGDRAVPRGRTVESVPGGGFRHVDDPPLKLIIFDHRVAMFPVDPLDFEAGFVEVNDPATVQRLYVYFQRLWSTGTDPFRQGVPPIDLTPRERALVSLLSQGHTDVTAAAALNISARTVAYVMRALMDRLGVENRFQLALLLGASGAVPPPTRPPHEEG